MGRLGLVGMGWLVEGVFVVGANRVQRYRTREVHVYMWEPHQPPAVVERYVGLGWYRADCSIVGMRPTGWERHTQSPNVHSGSNENIT